ncbi:response regulator [Leptolyngbya sp. NIES-2104]|uniref:response regulator n=1 Tax=Leptolyngbya sp. NIES-2104 TaxID=1552121 RepID=UPI0006ECBD11|nr:response regulator [Leptolyngbya sp. NIES-2104]GAP95511.1 two-component hybrid sensor and regulator [Leptolyngbya sp. NIES-2104]
MTPLRILLIDDNPGDRALAIRALQPAFPSLQVIEIFDQGSLNRAIQAKTFDVVVTDFQIRWTTGIDVLLAVKERDPNIPVIMFTDTGTEEIAVEAMKLGLNDYILKRADRYTRLPGAVIRAIDDAKTHAELDYYRNIRFDDLQKVLSTIEEISSQLLQDQSRPASDQTDLQQIHDQARQATQLLQALIELPTE